ncbi:MAG TPA: ROK family protein [Thermoleophilaceae bacterium]|jgi:glucokinase|nr:ROK family protein [Thermoleophilaceae bacterium]
MRVLGIDVGGTKVEIASVVDGRAIAPQQERTPLEDSGALIDCIESLARTVIDQDGAPEAIGVGVPSQVDYATGTVVSSVNIPLEGVALRAELESRFGVPVFVDNDGNVAALAEAQLVEDGPTSHLVMLTLGTGVGGGVIIDGRVFRGATGLGAELGHMVIEADGLPCPGRTCPNRGCIEAYCSGSALERAAGVSGEDVEARARQGDGVARGHLEDLGRWLGVGLSNFVNIFEPEHIVIGGGLGASASDLFLPTALEEARSRALPPGLKRLKVSLAKGGSDAGVIGAGVLAQMEHALTMGERDTARSKT